MLLEHLRKEIHVAEADKLRDMFDRILGRFQQTRGGLDAQAVLIGDRRGAVARFEMTRQIISGHTAPSRWR